MGIRSDELPALQGRIIIKNVIHCRPHRVQRGVLHMINVVQIFPCLCAEHRNPRRNTAVCHVIIPVSALHQPHVDRVGTGTDEVLPNLFVGSLNGRDNGDDGRDTDNDTQRR